MVFANLIDLIDFLLVDIGIDNLYAIIKIADHQILFADNGFGGYIYVGRDQPIYLTAMGDFDLSLTLTNQITFKTELEDDTIGSGKGKIEAIYFDGLYEDAAPTGLFTNSELILLHR